MAQVAVHTARFPVFADIASAYSLAFVLKLYLPFPAFTSSALDPATTEILDIAVIGSLISSFLFIVDPVNKFVRLFLVRLLTRNNAPKKEWAFNVLNLLKLKWVDTDFRPGYYRLKAATAYYTPYLAKLRAQISGGAIFSLIMFMLAPVALAKSPLIAIVLLGLGFVTTYSIARDIWWKVPAYSWIVTVYEIMVGSMPKSEIKDLNLITKHLLEANWEEARSWLEYELSQIEPIEKK